MSINGISNQTYTDTTKIAAKPETAANLEAIAKKTTTGINNTGDVYESAKVPKKTTYKQNTNLVNQLKADAEKRNAQMKSLVEELMMKQGQTSNNSDGMWKFLAKGNFTVSAETANKAKEDISAKGYWGVEQTSDRIVSFAKALTGGDPTKADEMLKAFEKGYQAATKSWGQKLPDISSQTRDSVLKKFQTWKDEKAEQTGIF